MYTSSRSSLRRLRPLLFVLMLALLSLPPATPAAADSTYQTLPFSQDWSDTGLITTNDDWSGVPGIVGYRGDDLTTATGTDPQTILADDSPGVVDVNANRSDPDSFATGGATEFELTNPSVALAGSGTANAPYLLIHLNTSGQSNIQVSYNLRDLDGSADNAVQQVALHYRVGTSGSFTNVPAAYVADATTGGTASQVTPVSVTLPAAAENQAQLQLRIMTTNAVGNDEWVGVDDIAITAGGGGSNASIVPTCPATLNVDAGVGGSVVLSATDSDGTVTSAAITSAAVAGIALGAQSPAASVGGTFTTTLQVASSVAAGDYAVDITFSNNDSTPQTNTCTVNVSVAADFCATAPADLEPIYAVQGSGLTSPLVGQDVSVRGIVTGDFQGDSGLRGFFLQEQVGDGDPATSDGIFIFVPSGNPLSSVDVAVGDVVQLSGTVTEFGSTTTPETLTEIDNLTELDVCGTATVPAPVVVDLPVPTTTGLERYEGMLVAFQEELTVSQNFFQGRYGQVTLSAEGRLYQPTNFFSDTVALSEAFALNTRRTIILDDGRSSQNPDPVPYIGDANTLRAGDTTQVLTGTLDFGLITNGDERYYRLHPTAPVSFTRVNERPEAPAPVGGNVKVGSMNVLNYFTTLDQSGASCFPGGARSDCRGADNTAEFIRQQAKIVSAISTLDADVLGLIEIENNGDDAVSALVTALNAVTTTTTYTYVVAPAPNVGDDAIRVGLIYQPAVVTPVGAALLDDDPIYDRVPLAQTFELVENGERFSVIVNHFKSKGSCPDDPDDPDGDQGDGQGCWNQLRVEQSQQLLTFIDEVQTSAGDDDVVIIGDLNAYAEEDPIQALEAGGLVLDAERFIAPADRYSFVFDGAAGELDHILTTESLSAQATGMAIWHINADEPSVLDYNTEFNPPGLYEPSPYRSSDHDPLLIGLQLQPEPLTPANFAGSSKTVNSTTANSGDVLTYTLTISNSGETGTIFDLIDTLPSGLSLLNAPGFTVNGQQLTLEASVAANSMATYTIAVVVTAAGPATITNVAQLDGDGQLRNLTAPSVTVSADPLTPASLVGSSKTVNTAFANPGDVLTYTLTLSNSGQTSTSFTLTDTLPGGLGLISAPGLTANGDQLTANGSVGGGTALTYTVVVSVTASDPVTITNVAQLSGDGQQRELRAPTVTVQLAPLSAANLAGSGKAINTTAVFSGDMVTYTLTISNSGQQSATFSLTDTLPTGLQLISAPGLTANGQRLTASGTVGGGLSLVYTIVVRVTAQGPTSITNVAQLSGDGQTRNLVSPRLEVVPDPQAQFDLYLPIINR